MQTRKRKYSEVIEEEDNLSPWNHLPDVPLLKIYSYLSWKDRTSASLVCRKWSRAFPAACNWRRVQVGLTGKLDSGDYNSMMKLLTRFGHMLHHVEITYRGSPYYDNQIFIASNSFQSLCKLLSEKAQLSSLSVANLGSFFRRTGDYYKTAITNCMVSLLNTQDGLKVVNFDHCGFNHKDLAKIFNAILNKSSLSKIRLHDIPFNEWEDDDWDGNGIDDDEDDEDEGDDDIGYEDEAEGVSDTDDDEENEKVMHWFCRCLRSLMHWESNYSMFLEILVSNLASYLKKHYLADYKKTQGTLKVMNIHWTGWYRELRGISDEAWEYFSKFFPDLQVNLDIDTIQNDIDPKFIMRFLITKNIPLRYLKFTIDDCHDLGLETLSLAKLLNHIVQCRLHSVIEVLRLENFSLGGVSVDLANFHDWTNLKIFEMETSYSLHNVKRALETALENCPKRLEQITMTVTSIVRPFEHSALLKIEKYFAPKFQEKGVILKILSRFEQY